MLQREGERARERERATSAHSPGERKRQERESMDLAADEQMKGSCAVDSMVATATANTTKRRKSQQRDARKERIANLHTTREEVKVEMSLRVQERERINERRRKGRQGQSGQGDFATCAKTNPNAKAKTSKAAANKLWVWMKTPSVHMTRINHHRDAWQPTGDIRS